MKKHAKKLITMLLVIAMLIPTVAMIYSSAAITDYSVELAFNNIFVFDKWANNTLSTTMVSGGAPVENELDIDIDAGSFTFTNPYSGEAYTGHGMGQGAIDSAGNFQYYMMDVEPGAAYTFSYNVTSLTSDLVFSPYVFYFDENGSYLTLANHSVASTGEASFVFFAPSNAHYLQVRFTLSGTGSVTAEDIAIRMTDISSYGANIFDFDSWAGNTNSGKVSETAAYSGGTIAKDTTNNAVTLTTDGSTTYLFTGHTFGSDGNNYYMIPVEAGATYNFSYNLSSCNFAPANYTPYILYCDSTGTYKSPLTISATNIGSNKFVFTVPAGIANIQIAYGISNAKSGYTCTVKDLAIQKITLSTADTNADVPHRLVYTYKGDNATTYGALPVPSYAPNGYVFAGWYTGPNGTGELITENTLVDCTSYTVYSKYEPIVNSITIKTLPIKTSYTVGERVNPTGLVLEATASNLTTTIESGYRCTPEYLTATGTQTITVHYGGKTATYTVEVSASASKSVVVNSSTVNVNVANNVYTFASTVNTGEFNRYVITYNSDAYFEGIITYDDDTTEQFFLEPSSNFGEGETSKFTSFVDGYLEKVINGAGETTEINSHSYSGIKSIAFTPLDNKAGSIDLLSITTSKATQITNAADTLKSFSDDRFKVVIDILNGGVVSGIYALEGDVVARVYRHYDTEGNYTDETLVDYKENLPASGYISESTEVNLINTYDTGRYLQQSYYGTAEKPYETGYYNRADWNYNPVQGGNVANEASKVIDYEIGDDYIYVKARPLDWAKWSDNHAGKCTHETEVHTEACWGEEYITDTYVEAKYVFEDGVIKTYCRMVDYSGYPSAQTTQELPAFYTIEPLNNFVYNDVTEDEAWVIQNLKYDESPEFWGISQDYKNAHYANGGFDPNVDVAEHWAAFMASESSNSFGIGLYTPETTNFYYGCYPSIYSETINSDGTFTQTNTLNYRHAETVNPAIEDDSSYIAPIGVKTFESYKPTEYMYSLTTGTVDDIQDTFGLIYDERYESELERVQIGVPETIYMTPSATTSTTGQYFVNNTLNADGEFTADAVNNATNGIISVYAPGSTAISFNVSAVTDGIGDPVFGDGTVGNGTGYENTRWAHSTIYGYYGTGAAQDWFQFEALGLAINGTGVAAGGTALLEWEITIYYGDDDQTGVKHYAYTTLYSPWLEPVGAATRAQSGSNGSKVYDQSVAWVSGVHGYTANSNGYYWVAATNQTIADEGENSGKGTYYAKTSDYALVPLLYGIGDPGNTGTAVLDYLTSSSPGGGITSPTIRYFNLTASSGNFGILVSDISPVANITVDTSRYTNFNQIPNLKVGYNITDIDNASNVIWYVSDLTDIANSATDATTHEVKFYNYTKQESADGINDKAKDEWFTGKATGNLIYGSATVNSGSTYDAVSSVEEYEDAWDRGIVTGSETYDYMFKGAARAYASKGQAYSLNHVQLRATNVNKTNLRDLIVLASGLDESNYTEASWSALKTALQAAAIELGNPTDSDISAAEEELKNKLMALQTPVTLNANGGSFSGGATETTVNLTCGPRLTPYYTISVENNPTLAGYSVEGWSTEANATEGTNPVMGGLKPTFYAIWTEGSYTIIYNANGGAGFIADVTLKHSDSVELATLGFTRDGHSLVGWAKSATATSPEYLLGETVSGLSNNTATTVTLYAVWLESEYTIIYNANGGSGSLTGQKVEIDESVTLASSGFTKDGYTLLGWATNASASAPEYQLGQTVSHLAAGGTITLYAVWEEAIFNVTFDNLIDFDAYNKSLSSTKGTVTNITDTGFTITSVDGVSEATLSSHYFEVDAGKKYKIDIDIEGSGWDVYIFFHNETSTGTGLEFKDATNRFSDNGGAGTNVFTAPAGATKAQIRVDCNGTYTGTVNNVKQYTSNTVTFDNIRVYEDTGITVSPVNKYVQYDSAYGELPVPTRAGYDFVGWYDGDTQVTATSTLTTAGTVYLTSKWAINDSALAADTVVIDFGTPVKFDPTANDAIFNAASGTKTLLGFSADGSASYTGTYGTFTFSGTEVTYTPTAVVNGADEVYYYVSDGTATAKSKITVVPASNVLYEDTRFVAGSGTTGVEWKSTSGTALNLSTSNDGIYGYDDSYNSYSQYSNNTALTATIDSETKRSRIMTFTFTGTGFDLYSACGATTGVQIVTVKSHATGKVINATVVDTYYNDTSYSTLYQVPIVSISDLDHGTYTVQVAATYISNSGAVKNAAQNVSTESVSGIDVYSASADNAAVREMLADAGMEYVLDAEKVNVVWFDDDSVFNGGKGVETQADGTVSTASTTVTLLNVIDSIRIYNPIADGDAYYNENEVGAKYYNVMDNLMSDDGSITAESLFAYVSGNANSQITIDNYNSVGPKDEIYLANTATKAITFTVDGVNNDTRVMISLRAAYGKPTAKIGNVHDEIPGNTEMYYDITDYIDKTTGTVTIQNVSTDASLLAIGYVKVTGATATVLNTFNLETASVMMAAPSEEVDFNSPKTDPEATTPEEDAGADDSSDATESWLTRLINYIVELVKKIVSLAKSLFASVTSLLSF